MMIQIAEILDYLKNENIPFVFEGSETETVDRFSSLVKYKEGSFTWIKNNESIPDGYDLSRIKLAFVAEDVCGAFQNVIRTAQSKKAFFAVMEHFYGQEDERPAIGQFTYISPKVKLGKNVRIGHNCTLDGDITIGDNTIIWNNVSIIGRVSIGTDCEIRSGVVIGHECLAYTEDEHHNRTMIKHFGGVRIGNNVLISNQAFIACGTIDDTVLEDGVLVDGMAIVAHNCYVGKNAAIVSRSTIFGSAQIDEGAYVCGAMVRGHIKVGKEAFVGIGAVVVKDVPDNTAVKGFPAKPFEKKD